MAIAKLKTRLSLLSPKDLVNNRDMDNKSFEKNLSVNDTHSPVFGYLLWIFGFMGAHRFYYGRPISGTLYFLTFGVLGIGWLIDLFLIPSMDRKADFKYSEGPYDYNLAWALLTFLGVFGVHRFYQKKWATGILYLATGGLFLVGVLYDYLNLNEQLHELNTEAGHVQARLN